MSCARPLSRRALLFGRPAAEAAPLRPPWARPEAAFSQACTRCDDCIRACPESVLARGRDGLPRFDPQAGECTFCGDCAAACQHDAFRARDEIPWQLRAHVADACLPARGVVCASCRDACPETAIRIPPGARGAATVDAGACTGCGACVGVCPVGAVSLSASSVEATA